MSTVTPRVLHIQPLSKEVEELYSHHGQYHYGDSGLDLFIIEDATVKAGETAFLHLGIKCAAYNEDNQNISWLVFPRSSISKTSLRLANSVGLIDAGYRGEIVACLDNIKSVDYSVKKGDRLLQAVFPDLGPFSFKIVGELNTTSRGEKGFGSTTAKPTEQSTKAEPTKESITAKTTEESITAKPTEESITAEPTEQSASTDCSTVTSEGVSITEDGFALEKSKKSDVELENFPPKEQESRKRNSDTELKKPNVKVKKPRRDAAKSQEASQS